MLNLDVSRLQNLVLHLDISNLHVIVSRLQERLFKRTVLQNKGSIIIAILITFFIDSFNLVP
jgi:uncharacterized membrane protein